MNISSHIKTTSSPESIEMIASFLENHVEGVITTINEEGIPQASVINVSVKQNFETFFVTERQTTKYKNLQNNHNVVFVSYDSFSRAEVEIEGVAYEVSDEQVRADEKAKVEEAIQLHKRHTPPYKSIHSAEHPVFVIFPKRIHMVTYLKDAAETQAFHETIEFNLPSTF